MNNKNRKKSLKIFNSILNSTLLRKKKISGIKIKKTKHLNRKLKLQMIDYKYSIQSYKSLSIYKNFKYSIGFTSIFF